MIGESNYIEIMKNCSNWNSRIETERKGRYPVLDAQTGIAQRPSQNSPVTFVNRYSSALPSQVCVYMSKRWKKRIAAPSSDATEMKYIVQCNPAINDVLNQTTTNNSQSDFSMVSGETSLTPSEIVQIEKRSIKIPYEATFDDEIEDRSEEEPLEISDEDEWSEGKRKRKKRNTANVSTASRSTSRKSNANSSSACNNSGSSNAQNSTSLNVPTQPNDPKPFVCQQCGAKYKSRPGLNYHRAHVHPETASRSSTPHLEVDISPICDLCLGDRNENKKTLLPEILVSCHDCGRSGHPSCLKFTDNMLVSTKKYGWQCIECKSCAICGTSDNDDQLLFCDDCDRGFHLYCLQPRLLSAPEGEWSCYLCQKQFGAKASLPIITSNGSDTVR